MMNRRGWIVVLIFMALVLAFSKARAVEPKADTNSQKCGADSFAIERDVRSIL